MRHMRDQLLTTNRIIYLGLVYTRTITAADLG